MRKPTNQNAVWLIDPRRIQFIRRGYIDLDPFSEKSKFFPEKVVVVDFFLTTPLLDTERLIKREHKNG